ncbi:MAG: hypothetical protein QXN68_00530 [Thermoplasmata archaeon]
MKKEYDVKITIKKGLETAIMGAVGALISYLTSLPPTETIIATTAILKMIENYLKNKN